MDNQLIVTWVIIIVVAIGFDIGVHLFLRWYWKENNVILTDMWLGKVFDRVDFLFELLDRLGQRVRALLILPVHATSKPATVFATPKAKAEIPSLSEPAPEAPEVEEAAAPPIEIIPVSVENIDGVRRVNFTLEMPLNTKVDVRIGATQEAGVTIEKRELS